MQKTNRSRPQNKVILGLFLFGTVRAGEFFEKGFIFISIDNDLHHVLTQAGAYVNDMGTIAKERARAEEEPTAFF
jgi:4-hydroxy-2-oxoheptanedioate aldolase